MTTRKQIVEAARRYLGTPFQHQGRLQGIALDCVGLPICIGRDLGLSVPDYHNYSPEPADDTVLQECKKNLREVSLEEMKPGDILCMRVPVPCHTAIVTELLGQTGIIHAYSGIGKVVEHNLNLQWRRRIAGVFQFPGVEN